MNTSIVPKHNIKIIRVFVNQYGEAWIDPRDAEMVKQSVMPYLKANVEDNVDWKTMEVNHTHLAEDAAAHFDIYVSNAQCSIPTQIYDWAIEVGMDWERDNQVD